MELDRRLLLAHCAAHALSVVAGLLVVVPMALNGSAFKGRCALFSTGYWKTEDRAEATGESRELTHLVVQQWGPLAACQFTTFVGIFTVLYGAAQGWRCLFYLHGRHDEWVRWAADTHAVMVAALTSITTDDGDWPRSATAAVLAILSLYLQ